jgi:hypothetical protein
MLPETKGKSLEELDPETQAAPRGGGAPRLARA